MASIYGANRWLAILLSVARPAGKELIATGSLLANPAEVRLTFDARDRVYVNIDGNASTHERKVNAELTLAGNDVAAGDALRKFGPRNGMRAPLVGAAVAQGALDRNSAVEYIADMKKSHSTKMWSLSELTRENIFFMRIIHLIWVIIFMFDEMFSPLFFDRCCSF